MRGRRRLAAMLLVFIGAVAAAACNLLTGVGDLETSDVGETGTVDDSGGGTRLDAGGDGAVVPLPTCECVSAAPADWTGPVALLEARDVARACPPGLMPVLAGGTDPSAPSPCTPCTCGGPIGSCTTAGVETHAGSICGGGCGTRTIDASCGPVTYCAPGSSATATALVDSGACAPDGGLPAAAAWGHTASACAFAAAPSTTCAAGQACAPKSAAAPDARTCILHAGDVACPPGAFGTRVVYDAKIADTRACSACTCDPPTGTCSAGAVTLYGDTTCKNATSVVSTTGACASFSVVTPAGSGKLTMPSQLLDGGCAPHGGALTDGGLAGADPTTLCCL